FHQAIVAGCPNSWLRRVHTLLYSQSERYRRLSLTASARDVQHEHKALLDALLARDPERAQALIAQHLQTTTDLLLASPLLGVVPAR
ncbi:MAG TPA: FCD domain-containing protein, partial [Variovorax sp.]